MTSLTSISHTAKRAHGITTQTTEYFDTLGVLQKRKQMYLMPTMY